MRWPLDSVYITQGFSSGHQGVDLGAPRGTTIKAPESGVVVAVNNIAQNYFGGLYIKMRGDSGYTYYLGHNSKNFVNAGDRVSEGQHIGDVGMTVGPGGTATGPHVHFEMSIDGRIVDPEKLIKKEVVVKPTEKEIVEVFSSYLFAKPTKEQVNFYMQRDSRELYKDVLYGTRPQPDEVTKTFNRLLPGTDDPKRLPYYTARNATIMYSDIAGALRRELNRKPTPEGDFVEVTEKLYRKK